MRDYDKVFQSSGKLVETWKHIDSNVMEKLASAIKESAKDSNEDKKYYLGKLKTLNTLSTDLNQQAQTISKLQNISESKRKKTTIKDSESSSIKFCGPAVAFDTSF
jgi:predicted RNase H-like nuclease (RuvC/YqgF family)